MNFVVWQYFRHPKRSRLWVVTWKTGPFRIPKILSNDEIQVFKNLRPPVSEELILFKVFLKSFSDECTDFLIFWQELLAGKPGSIWEDIIRVDLKENGYQRGKLDGFNSGYRLLENPYGLYGVISGLQCTLYLPVGLRKVVSNYFSRTVSVYTLHFQCRSAFLQLPNHLFYINTA